MSARWVDAVIPINTAVSNNLNLIQGECVLGVFTPSAWTAADIRLQVSFDGTTFVDIMDAAGTLLKQYTTIATAASEFHVASPINVAGATQGTRGIPLGSNVRIRSVNTISDADVNQAAARTVRVLVGREDR